MKYRVNFGDGSVTPQTFKSQKDADRWITSARQHGGDPHRHRYFVEFWDPVAGWLAVTPSRKPQKSQKLMPAHATKLIRVDIGKGLKDGIKSAGTNVRLRDLREAGATDIKLAETGRLSFTRNGQRYEYRVTLPRDRRESDELFAAGATSSPLTRALADIESGRY